MDISSAIKCCIWQTQQAINNLRDNMCYPYPIRILEEAIKRLEEELKEHKDN